MGAQRYMKIDHRIPCTTSQWQERTTKGENERGFACFKARNYICVVEKFS